MRIRVRRRVSEDTWVERQIVVRSHKGRWVGTRTGGSPMGMAHVPARLHMRTSANATSCDV